MAITASKPAINIREKLAELDQPQGIKGTEVLRADTADEARNAIGARGRKNLLINSGFDVWQRGTSFTGAGYTADRWIISTSNSGLAVTKTANRDTYNTLKITMAGSSCNIDQRVEAFGGIAYNKKVTVSFWARGSGSFSNIKSRIRNHTTATNLEDAFYNVTTSWTKITFTFSANNTWAKDDVGRFYLMLGPNVMSSGDWVEFSNVQLELGDQATEFEHRSYGEELALCQRYYYRINANGETHRVITAGTGASNTAGFYPLQFPTEMRGIPTLYVSNVAHWRSTNVFANSSTFTSMAIGYNGTDGCAIYSTEPSISAGAAKLLGCQDASAWLAFGAEL